jgi:hypothetical protein
MKKIPIFIFLVFLHSASVASDYVGAWEGFKLIGSTYISQIMVIEKSGNGFFAFRINEPRKDFIIPISLSSSSNKDNFTNINFSPNNYISHQLALSQDRLGEVTNAIYQLRSSENGILQSYSLQLVKTSIDNLIDKRLYDFAKNNL